MLSPALPAMQLLLPLALSATRLLLPLALPAPQRPLLPPHAKETKRNGRDRQTLLLSGAEVATEEGRHLLGRPTRAQHSPRADSPGRASKALRGAVPPRLRQRCPPRLALRADEE